MTRISIKRALASIASAIVALFSTSAPAISEFGDDGDTGGLPNKVYDAVAWQGITLPKVNVICSPYCRIDAGASGAYTIVLAGGLGYFQRLAITEDRLIATIEYAQLVLKHEKTTPDLRCNSEAKKRREAGDKRFATDSGASLNERLTAATAMYQAIAAQDYISGIAGGGKGAIREILTSQMLGTLDNKPVFMFPFTYNDGKMERFPVKPEAMFSDLPLSISPDYNNGYLTPETRWGGGGPPKGCPFGGGGVTG